MSRIQAKYKQNFIYKSGRVSYTRCIIFIHFRSMPKLIFIQIVSFYVLAIRMTWLFFHRKFTYNFSCPFFIHKCLRVIWVSNELLFNFLIFEFKQHQKKSIENKKFRPLLGVKFNSRALGKRFVDF
jgi:hypothetical protein